MGLLLLRSSLSVATVLQVMVHVIAILMVALSLVLIYVEVTDAHRPLFTDEKANEPASAVRVSDPAVSHVVYVELKETSHHKWIVFENDQRQVVPITVGVPAGMSDTPAEPVVVVFGPGWGELPEGLPVQPPQREGGKGEAVGAVVLRPGGRSHRFYEPITGTASQILIETEVELSEPDTYYAVVYDEIGQGGKLWVSIGESEGFSWRDVFRLPGWIGEVRRFHEVGGWPRWAQIGTLILLATAFVIIAWVKFGRKD